MLLLASFGCSSRTVVVHDEPRLISQGEERLVVEIESIVKERLRLRAFRERENTYEQHFWRAQESSRVTPADPPAGAQEASLLSSLPPDTGGAFFWALVAAGVVVFFIIAIPIFYFVVIAQGAAAFMSVTVDSERTTVQHQETHRQPSAYVTIEPVKGGEPVNLGPQPENGWLLTPELLARMGGLGSEAIVRDGPLSATVVLQPR